MRGYSLLLAATLVVSASTAAIAETSAGTVLQFDNHLHSIILDTGEIFALPRDGMVDHVSAGDYVIIGWSLEGNERVASSVYEPNGTKGY